MNATIIASAKTLILIVETMIVASLLGLVKLMRFTIQPQLQDGCITYDFRINVILNKYQEDDTLLFTQLNTHR